MIRKQADPAKRRRANMDFLQMDRPWRARSCERTTILDQLDALGLETKVLFEARRITKSCRNSLAPSRHPSCSRRLAQRSPCSKGVHRRGIAAADESSCGFAD